MREWHRQGILRLHFPKTMELTTTRADFRRLEGL